jgi:hypothetical protein
MVCREEETGKKTVFLKLPAFAIFQKLEAL